MFCKKCGLEYEGDACPVCPADVAEPTTTSAPAKAANPATDIVSTIKKIGVKKLAIAGVALLLVVVLLFTGLIALFSRAPYEITRFGQFDAITPIGEGMFRVTEGNNWGIINERGNFILGIRDYEDFHSAFDGFMIVSERNDTYLLNSNGRRVTTFDRRYNSVSFLGSTDRFLVRNDDRVGVINRRGRDVIEPNTRIRSISRSSCGNWYIVTNNDNERAVYNSRGNITGIRYGRYDTIIPISGNRFIVQNADRWSVVNSRDNTSIDSGIFDNIQYAPGVGFIVRNGQHWGVANNRGNMIISANSYYSNIVQHGNYFVVRNSDGELGVYNRRGRIAIPFGDFDNITPILGNEGFFTIRDGGDWGVIDTRGREVVAARYQSITSAGDMGFIVRYDGEFGLYNRRGNIAVATRYDSMSVIGDGFFRVREGSSYGIINARGREVVSIGRYGQDARFSWMYGNLVLISRPRDGAARTEISLTNINRRPPRGNR